MSMRFLVQHRPPSRPRASKPMTSKPRSTNARAAARPDIPAPTTRIVFLRLRMVAETAAPVRSALLPFMPIPSLFSSLRQQRCAHDHQYERENSRNTEVFSQHECAEDYCHSSLEAQHEDVRHAEIRGAHCTALQKRPDYKQAKKRKGGREPAQAGRILHEQSAAGVCCGSDQ